MPADKTTDRELEKLVSDLCDIILTEKDHVDDYYYEDSRIYISELTEGEIAKLNSDNERTRKDVRKAVFNKIKVYIDKYRVHDSATGVPFAFDMGTQYAEYQDWFMKEYAGKHQDSNFSVLLSDILEYIAEVSEHYRTFSVFFDAQIRSSSYEILQNMEEWAKNETDEAIRKKLPEAVGEATKKTIDAAVREIEEETKKIIENAVAEANRQAEEAKDEAENAKREAENAKKEAENAKKEAENAKENAENAATKAVKEAVDERMPQVTEHISETSVTILGIFAGIVLTVVAGLFYSSAVVGNVASADVFKLIPIASVVGLVCIDLVFLMFDYVNKIRNNGKTQSLRTALDNEKKQQGNNPAQVNIVERATEKPIEIFKRNILIIAVNIVLILTMSISSVAYWKDSHGNKGGTDMQQNESDVNGEENIINDDCAAPVESTTIPTDIPPIFTPSPQLTEFPEADS